MLIPALFTALKLRINTLFLLPFRLPVGQLVWKRWTASFLLCL